MRILAVIRQTRHYPVCLRSIRQALTYPGVDQLWLTSQLVPSEPRYEDNTRRLQLARTLFLAGPWDAMVVIDDDLVVPKNTLDKLLSHRNPVVMGLTVRRTDPHLWSAVIQSNGIEDYVTLDMKPALAHQWWGKTIEVKGCGHNPTLIRREVLEVIPFRREPGIHGADRFFALDCNRAQIPIWCDTSLMVGHFDGETVHYPKVEDL